MNDSSKTPEKMNNNCYFPHWKVKKFYSPHMDPQEIRKKITIYVEIYYISHIGKPLILLEY